MGSAPVFWTLLAIVCLAAAAWGGGPERVAATVFVAATVASHLLYRAPDQRYYQLEINILVVDLAVLAGMVALVVLADRFWPILMSAVCAVSVAGHVGKMLGHDWVRLTYAIAIVGPSYVTLLVLAAATLRHRLRLRRTGRDHPWNTALLGSRRIVSGP